jgi:glutathione synthase/RimK-type ligase-like ATP-grasp enzyme
MIAPNAFWANSKEASMRTNCKLSQLKVAKKLGFNVPETLISTDPVAIKAFIQKHPSGEVIYKPLFPVMWVESDVMRLTYTKPIYLGDLPSNEILRLTPGIYQKRIEKAFELRVTCMGHSAFATKIYSQAHESGKEDWRSAPAHEMKMEPYPFPPELAAKCFALMLKFGVVFGCFDFIVTPEGEYVFLEINEQGQFLWQEEQNNNITLLDPFVQFLIERKSNFVWKKPEETINMRTFRESIIQQQKAAMATHVDPGLFI